MTTQDPISELATATCWEKLGTQQLGRIVTNAAGILDVFPVNYVVDGESVVFRTAEGNKLVELTLSDEVLFEVDSYTDADAWSVIIRGKATKLETEAEIDAAEELDLQPFAPTVKRNFVRITADQITGRAFPRGEEPPHSIY
jgi:nitroimidazol reductase NimA-like FMN-containing flavoprotein (pyridoxamine 5'-phosphate oxidase superfamily)